MRVFRAKLSGSALVPGSKKSLARGGCCGDGLVAGGRCHGEYGAVVISSRCDVLEFLMVLEEEGKVGRDYGHSCE